MYALKCLSKLEIHLVQNTKYQSTSEARTDSSGLTIFDKFLILSPDTSGRIMGLITYFTKLPMDFNESKYINCQSAHSHLKKTLKLFCGIAMDLNPWMMSSLTGLCPSHGRLLEHDSRPRPDCCEMMQLCSGDFPALAKAALKEYEVKRQKRKWMQDTLFSTTKERLIESG